MAGTSNIRPEPRGTSQIRLDMDCIHPWIGLCNWLYIVTITAHINPIRVHVWNTQVNFELRVKQWKSDGRWYALDWVKVVTMRTGLDWVGSLFDALDWTGSGKNGPVSNCVADASHSTMSKQYNRLSLRVGNVSATATAIVATTGPENVSTALTSRLDFTAKDATTGGTGLRQLLTAHVRLLN